MPEDLIQLAYELKKAGESFAVASVVRAEKPTSAKAGAKAIITEDGRLTGWVGGSCAEPTVRREARKALQDGKHRMLRLCPPENIGMAPQEGVVEVPMTCISGGTLEIFIEPQLSQPQLLVVGHLATAQALASLGKSLGLPVSVVGLEATHERFPQADQVMDSLDLSQLEINPRTCIVVASHGNYDEEALLQALASNASYVALVSSKSRAAAIIQYLSDSSLPKDRLERLKYPAGLDIGAVTPEEIALSILAEIVLFQRRGQAVPDIAVDEAEIAETIEEAIDPVCGMMVEVATAHHTLEYHGQVYYFCAPGCKISFGREPEKYIANVSDPE